MRKRLVIGAIAVVVIGAGAYLLSQPRKGTVGWHKREYLAVVCPRLPLKELIASRLAGRDPYASCFGALPPNEKALTHLRALEDLGYLRRRTIAGVDIQGAREDRLRRQATEEFSHQHIWDVRGAGIDSLSVVYEPRDEVTWERLIRETDVPENK